MANRHQEVIDAGADFAHKLVHLYANHIGGDHEMKDWLKAGAHFNDNIYEQRGVLYYLNRHSAIGLFNLRPASGDVKCILGEERILSKKPVSKEVASVENVKGPDLPFEETLTDIQTIRMAEASEIGVNAEIELTQKFTYGSKDTLGFEGETELRLRLETAYKKAIEKVLEQQKGKERHYGPILVPEGFGYKAIHEHNEIKTEQDIIFEAPLEFDVNLWCECKGRKSSGWAFTIPNGRDGLRLFLRGHFTGKWPDGENVDWHFNHFKKHPVASEQIERILDIPVIARVTRTEPAIVAKEQKYRFEQYPL